MTKKMLMNISLIALSVMLLLGVSLTVYVLITGNDSRIIDVQISDGKTETVEFKSLNLLPGEEVVYTLALSGEKAEKYSVVLRFAPNDGSQTLAEYVYVRVEMGGKTACDTLLSNALLGDNIDLYADFSGNTNNDITVTYYLPQSVGNEAQNAAASFELLICASNE